MTNPPPSNVAIARLKRRIYHDSYERCAVCFNWFQYGQIACIAVAELWVKPNRKDLLDSHAYIICAGCFNTFAKSREVQRQIFHDLTGVKLT